MQRKLAFEHTPGLALPLRFLLAAPWFGALAGLLLLWQGSEVLATRWSPVTLGFTHLLTLGFLGMAMAGSLLQMVPVVAGVALRLPPRVGGLLWGGLAGGTLLLVAGFLSGAPALLRSGGALLAVAFTLLLLVLARTLYRRVAPGSLPMVSGMRQALPALAIALGLGLALVAFLSGAARVPAMELTNVHAAWALVGWVGVLVVSVAFQVVPMFQSTQLFPRAVAFALPATCTLGLLVWTVAYLMGQHWHWIAAGVVAAALAAFGLWTLVLLWRRKRAPDVATWYWWMALASLLASVAVFLCPRGVDKALVLGVLFIGGFAMSAVNGMLYKIVPFLLWYHLQQCACGEHGAVPGVKVLMPESEARVQFAWHAASVLALLGACLAPEWLARPAGALLAVSCLRLAFDLLLPVLFYREVRANLQPS